MKINKLFLLGLAGLAFTACSSDEENQGSNLSGNGVVEVRIVNPTTRTLSDATSGDAGDKITVVPADGYYTVKLTAATGSATKQVTADDIRDGVVKFWGVKGPTKVEVWINDGDTKATGTASIETLQGIAPENYPAYGSSEAFNLTGKTETNEGKTYEMYSASVDLKIPVARLEVSGITHVDKDGNCSYGELTIDGIYLDKISLTDGGAIVDYSMPAIMDADGQTVVTPAPVLWDQIASASFLTPGAVWPAVATPAQCYNYYFYPKANQIPVLKIYFANAKHANDPTQVYSEPRYAMIKSYNGDPNFQFEKGKIYRITNVELDDDNIIGDEEGNTLYGVNVTVTEASWTIADLSAEWVTM